MCFVIARNIAIWAAFEYSLSDLNLWLEDVFAITTFDTGSTYINWLNMPWAVKSVNGSPGIHHTFYF